MVYMYHSFLIHSSADGHLGCFHVLAMINSASMNIFFNWSIIYLHYCWFSVHNTVTQYFYTLHMITMTCLVIICHHQRYNNRIDYIPLAVHSISMTHILVTLHLPHYFTHPPKPYPLWQLPVCSLYLWICSFVLFVHFLEYSTYKWNYAVFLIISLSIIPSRPIHVVANDHISFIFMAEQYIISRYTISSLSIRLSTDT